MSDSEAKPDTVVEEKVADVSPAMERNYNSDIEPPSELEQKIIRQVEVSNHGLFI